MTPALRDYRSNVQIVFQDPYSSINPAKRLGYVLSRPLANYKGLKGEQLRKASRTCSNGWRSPLPTASSTATATSCRVVSASA